MENKEKEVKKTTVKKTVKTDEIKPKKTTKKPETEKKVKKTPIIKDVEKEKPTVINEEIIKEIPVVKEETIHNIKEELKQATIKQIDKKLKPQHIFENISIILILIIISATFIFLVFSNKEQPQSENENLQKFEEQFNYILENYYGNITEEQLIEGAIDGMFQQLDDYSGYLDEPDSNESKTLEGTYQGIGIEIYNNEDGKIIISKVHENSPAEKAGIIANDEITKYNDQDLTGTLTSDLVDKIAVDQKFTLEIKRNEEIFTTELEKGTITIKSVHSEMLENNVGYIIIDIFANNTAEQFKQHLTNLENNGMEKLIVDVRNNSGGYLTTVEDITSQFFDSSYVIFKTEDNSGVENYFSTGDTTKTYPIVVLQNGLSASASEVLAAALKENANAYIIGTTSYGKGTVQTISNLGGQDEFKLTTKKWLTPNNNWVNEVGIIPDQEVELTVDYYLNPTLENDLQLQAAINYLK